MKKYLSTYCLLLLFATVVVGAQNDSNLRAFWLKVEADTQMLDTLSIVPESFVVLDQNEPINASAYQLDYVNAQLIWLDREGLDSVWLNYRVLPINFGKSLSHRSSDSIGRYGDLPLREIKVSDETEWLDFGGLNYQGSFGRGIQVGNTQDLSVNADFNLQLSGELSNGVEILASITDNNIPFQAQGNTQQLQDFDKIFVRLKKDEHTIVFGDYQINRPNSHFLNFQKKLQGVQYGYRSTDGRWESTTSAAVARGRYQRQVFAGIEGNQGPYKLLGANGETFIIILSGSERVYMDGELLIRGFDNDYIIDYNLGEIRFTNNRLITKDKRIVVEFEYSQRNYLRSLLHHQTNYEVEKLKLRLNVYTEQDAKNQPGLQELTAEQRGFLTQSGDAVSQVLAPSARAVSYEANRILYERIDTFINGQMDSLFRFTNNPDKSLYTVSFNNVGPNNGNYQLSDATLNGRVYEWVSPDATGLPQGSYAPVIQLVAPQKKQMATLGADYQLSEKTLVQTELSISGTDLNTFSSFGNNDNDGYGAWFGLTHKEQLGKNDDWSLKLLGEYEWIQEDFRPLEIHRNPEFTRDWNITQNRLEGQNNQNGVSGFNEQLGNVGFEIGKKDFGAIGYTFGFFNQEGNYDGKRHIATSNIRKNNWDFQAKLDWLDSENELTTARFIRPNIGLSKSWGNWQSGVKYFQEDNQIVQKSSDSLALTSFRFHQWEAFVKTKNEEGANYGVNYTKRIDDLPDDFQLAKATEADAIKLFAVFGQTSNQVTLNATYRALEVIDNTIAPDNLTDEQTLLGNFTWNWAVGKGFIRSATDYEVGAGQQQRVEYFYSPVAAALGDFIWIDRNENGLQENGEFEIANANSLEDSIRYIRLIIPSNEFERTAKVRLNQTFSINPKALWFSEKGLKKQLSKWSIFSAFLVNRQFNNEEGFEHFNPFYENDSTQVTANTAIRNTLFFNKSNPKIGGEIFYNIFANEVLLLGGTDGQDREEYGLRSRWGFADNWTFTVDALQSENINVSTAFDNRDYRIETWEVLPKITFRNGVVFRASLSYLEKHSTNFLSLGNEMALERSLSAEARWSIAGKSSLTSRLSWVNIQYEDPEGNTPMINTAAAFQILNGLLPGQNIVWNIDFETRLKNNLQLSFGYNGKKSRDLPITNVGRATVRALF